MYQRQCKPSKSNSFFLFGARGTGKTTLLEQYFSPTDTLFIDLLDINLMDELMLDSSRFQRLIDAPEHIHKRVVVDEIQKFPQLLNVVHQQIQKRKRQFVLTGSSARRLKQQGINLLAGRAWTYELFPFSTFEIGASFDLKRTLEFGALPEAYLASENAHAREYLNAYVGTYLQKEIQQERWVRKLEPFRKFLSVAAQMNGKIINKSAIALDVGIDDVTVANYFEILEDTLLGFNLPAFHQSVRKAQRQAPKFYLVDPGIKRALEKTLSVELLPQTSAWGDAFEHWVILDIIKNASYRRLDWSFSYLRTKDDAEIDLIVDRPGKKRVLIEIKSKSHVTSQDAKTLETLGLAVDPDAEHVLLSNDPLEAKFGKTHAIHWIEGIKRLFA